MIVMLLTEHPLECISLKGGCRGPSESTHVKMPHCWKSHALAQICFTECVENIKIPMFQLTGGRTKKMPTQT